MTIKILILASKIRTHNIYEDFTFYSSFIHGYLKLVLKFGQCSDLLVTESLFVDSLNVSLPWILTCWHPFTKWAGVFIIYAMRYQMDSHLAQHLPPFAAADTDVSIIHFHDNSFIDELLWKPKTMVFNENIKPKQVRYSTTCSTYKRPMGD